MQVQTLKPNLFIFYFLKNALKLKLRKRAVIESINDILMTAFDLEHTRHRSSVNALAHMMPALIAYGFYEQKPAVFVPKGR